jgi:peptide-methionine (S)-S-oxide reductase
MTRRAGPWALPAARSVGLIAATIAVLMLGPAAAEEGIASPAPTVDEAPTADEAATVGGTQVAVLAGGCFWGVQGVFQRVRGVRGAVSGYAGGVAGTAYYQLVGTGRTGHAEAVRITYDPAEISYGKLLQIFFSVAHDPTQLDRQGPDVGSQYRTAIFPANAEQAKVARDYIAQLDRARVFAKAIVTTVEPDRSFYPAEDYHQDFLTLNPTNPYIVHNDLPKIENLQRLYPDLFRDDPVLVSTAAHSG